MLQSETIYDEIILKTLLFIIDSLGFYFVAILLLIPLQDFDSPRFCAITAVHRRCMLCKSEGDSRVRKAHKTLTA